MERAQIKLATKMFYLSVLNFVLGLNVYVSSERKNLFCYPFGAGIFFFLILAHSVFKM